MKCFSKSVLSGCVLSGCVLSGCVLNVGVKNFTHRVGFTLYSTVHKGARDHIIWRDAIFSHEMFLKNVSFGIAIYE